MEAITQEQDNRQERLSNTEIANRLEELLKEKEDQDKRSGNSAIKTVITYLRRDEADRARAVCNNEHDKINDVMGENEQIRAFLIQELFRDQEEHPWSFFEHWGKDD